jgi:hypothetical protein
VRWWASSVSREEKDEGEVWQEGGRVQVYRELFPHVHKVSLSMERVENSRLTLREMRIETPSKWVSWRWRSLKRR